ncbi:hypothetical protein CEF21_14890 [Bacillus sp. FJAT-42376]|uniref:methylmalonyl-CoA mutase family protein n=1 Tax=Bacillus sp. FJAT-42376 TaxID=2014076 RepID=UPI000F50C6A4|nr:methylmalonyl-CoA mutase family protein [Bacillus sp. FJAT-42376]AZB43482.1 hypothetical protein CEF21_14890 [Bacillus sp. FJAT-42376]
MSKHQRVQEEHQSGLEQEWIQAVSRALKGKPADTLKTVTKENIILKPLYSKKDALHMPEPGSIPYTRGTQPVKEMWKTAQSVNQYTSIHDLCAALSSACEKGMNSFYFSSVSKLVSEKDASLLANSMKESNLHYMVDCGEAPHLMAFFAGSLREFGGGIIGTDPYEALMLGQLRDEDMLHALQWTADFTEASADRLNQKTLLFKGDYVHNCGADAVQELAYTFAKAVDYMNWYRQSGKTCDLAAKKTAFSFSAGSQFFMEIAKLRAARIIWSSIVSAFGGDPEAQKLYVHVKTSSYNKSKLDVHVNLLRTSTEAFSAVLGNADAITVLPFDEADGGSVLSERIAGNIHYLLSEESLLGKVNDPSGGSFYIESLTKELAEAAWEKMIQIEEKGGFLEALRSGSLQFDVDNTSQKQSDGLFTQQVKMIGVNDYANQEDQIHESREESRLFHWPEESFSSIQKKYEKGEDVWTQPAQGRIEKIKPVRLAEPYEKLRMHAQNYARRNGELPSVQVAVFGSLKEYKPRLDFLTGLLASGGMIPTVTSISDADLSKPLFLCGQNAAYIECEKDIQHVVNEASADVFITGRQPEEWDGRFSPDKEMTMGMNRLVFLQNLHVALGVANK